MKKSAIAVVVIIIALAVGICLIPSKQEEYLRIHIRANSNMDNDQAVKLEVRDAVVSYLTPVLAEVSTTDDAARLLEANLENMATVADNVLRQRGFYYGASAEIRWEEFPAREYGELVLDKGWYKSLIINLGTGDGDNWWCVAFPPLCFVPADNGKDVKYKSKILEIIENAKK